MKNLFEVQAELRTDEGKGASRRLRHAGKVPAIIYGADETPVSVSLDHNKFLRHLQEDAFYAHILTIDVDGKKQQAVLKDLQRHPASDVRIMHADFMRVKAGQALTMTVQLHFIGEDVAPGVKDGGEVAHLMSDIEITCLPKDLPEYIEVDVSALGMDEAIHLSEIALPKGITITALAHGDDEELAEGERSSYDQAAVSIHAPRVSSTAEEDDAADAAAAASAAAAEAEEASED